MRTGPVTGVLVCVLLFTAGRATTQPASSQQGTDDPAAAKAEAYRLFLRALHLGSADDIDGAIRSFRDASEVDQDAGEILAELSKLYVRHNRGEDALAAARQSLARDPENQSAHRILGLIFATRANDRSGTAEDAAEAIQHLEQARDTPLPDFQVELTLARLYLGNDKSQQAIDLLEEVQGDEPGLAETGMLLARAYEQVGRVSDAVATLERVVEDGRPSSRALRSLAELYGRDGRWSDAVAAYEQAVERNPRSARTRRELANASLKDDQATRARDVLNELVAIRPNDAAGLYLLSEVELDLHNFAAAEDLARKLIEVEPGGVRGTFALAEVYSRRRQHREVIDTLTPVLDDAEDRDLRPDQIAGLLGRVGFAHEQLQEFASAIRIYEEGVRLMPTSLAFGVRLAHAYINADRLDDARQVLQTVRGHHAGDLTLARLEARVLATGGDVDGGAAVLQGALEMRPGQPAPYLVLAAYYSEHDRFNDAVALLESAENQFPDETAILFQLGAVLEQNDLRGDAEEAFRRLLDRDPEHADTLNYLGYMLADRGERLEESVSLLERAIEIDPHNGAYLDSLGWAYFKLDRLDLAEVLLQQASDQMAWNSVIQDHLGDVLRRLGRYTDAIAAWERALAGDGDEVERSTIEQKIGNAKRQLEW